MHELNLINIQKKYKEKAAVSDFTYMFSNIVYGLLGENEAEKQL